MLTVAIIHKHKFDRRIRLSHCNRVNYPNTCRNNTNPRSQVLLRKGPDGDEMRMIMMMVNVDGEQRRRRKPGFSRRMTQSTHKSLKGWLKTHALMASKG